MNTDKVKILLLAANPIDTTPLQLDEEVRSIDAALQMARLRDHIELVSHWAVRVEDVLELLLRHRPLVIHFSGHGSPTNKIVLKTSTGASIEVDQNAFTLMLQAAGKTVTCVVLNACYSEPQAELLLDYIPAVVGVSGEIADDVAISFARAFYLAFGSGEQVKDAFQMAIAEVQMATPEAAHNIHLLGAAAALTYRIAARDQSSTMGASVSNSTIKGMVQVNYGDVTITFNDAPQ